MMLSEKQLFDYMSSAGSQKNRASLLSRASSLIMSNQINTVKQPECSRPSVIQMKAIQDFNAANKILNSYIHDNTFMQGQSPQSACKYQNNGRLSSSKSMESGSAIMLNIDEREGEIFSNRDCQASPAASPTHQCSKLSTAYNLRTFFTPARRSKKTIFESDTVKSCMQNQQASVLQSQEFGAAKSAHVERGQGDEDGQPAQGVFARQGSFHPKLALNQASPKAKDNYIIAEEEDVIQEDSEGSSRKQPAKQRMFRQHLEPEKQFTAVFGGEPPEPDSSLVQQFIGRISKSNKQLQQICYHQTTPFDEENAQKAFKNAIQSMNSPGPKIETPTGNEGTGVRYDRTPINERRPRKRDRPARNSSRAEENHSRSASRTRYNQERERDNKILKEALVRDLSEADENDCRTELWQTNRGVAYTGKDYNTLKEGESVGGALCETGQKHRTERDEQTEHIFLQNTGKSQKQAAGLNCFGSLGATARASPSGSALSRAKHHLNNSKHPQPATPHNEQLDVSLRLKKQGTGGSALAASPPGVTWKEQPKIDQAIHNLALLKLQNNFQQVTSEDDQTESKVEISRTMCKDKSQDETWNNSKQLDTPNKTYDGKLNGEAFDAIDQRFLQLKKNDSEKEKRQNPLEEGQNMHQLSSFVTKAPQLQSADQTSVDSSSFSQEYDAHKQHFLQTINQLKFIRQNLRIVDDSEVESKRVQLPPPRHPESQKKLAIFDMDETLIHCVDDIEKQESDVVLEIDFPDEETVYAGINIRPYIMECLQEASKNYQLIVFTASHQVYADAILDYIDPNHELIQHRLYRQHCVQTPEGYYVKDLRIFADTQFALSDIVIIDNSVFSFAFHIDNGIPIIPYYDEKGDEEMLHLIYYLNCLVGAQDIREQNRKAFELFKLANESTLGSGSDEQQVSREEPGEEQQLGSIMEEEEYQEACDNSSQNAKIEGEPSGSGSPKDAPPPDQTFRNVNFVLRASAEATSDHILKEAEAEPKSQTNATPAEIQQNQKENSNQNPQQTKEDLEAVLQNIYQNLIDEDDIIVEEESREGISQNTHQNQTARLSEIQLLNHNSNFSNNTGSELQKLVKIIKNNSYGSNKNYQHSKDNSYMIPSEMYDKISNTQSKLKEIGVINTSRIHNISEIPNNILGGSQGQSGGSGANISGSNQAKSNKEGTVGKITSMGSIPPIGDSSAAVGSIPQSSSNKKSGGKERRQKSTDADPLKMYVDTFDNGCEKSNKKLLRKIELDHSEPKKSHRQIIQTSKKTEQLDSIKINHSTSKTTKKNIFKHERLNDLHIEIVKFEEESESEQVQDQDLPNANEYLNDVNTPLVQVNHISPQQYRQSRDSKIQDDQGNRENAKSRSQTRRTRQSRTAARKEKVTNEALSAENRGDSGAGLFSSNHLRLTRTVKISIDQLRAKPDAEFQDQKDEAEARNNSRLNFRKQYSQQTASLLNQGFNQSLITFNRSQLQSTGKSHAEGGLLLSYNTAQTPSPILVISNGGGPVGELADGRSRSPSPTPVFTPPGRVLTEGPIAAFVNTRSPPKSILTRSVMSRQMRQSQASPNNRYHRRQSTDECQYTPDNEGQASH